MLRDATEQTIIGVSGKIAAGGSATAVGSGVTGKAIQLAAENPDVASAAMAWADVGIVCGMVVAAGGWASQIYFNVRRDSREKRLYEEQLRKLMRDYRE